MTPRTRARAVSRARDRTVTLLAAIGVALAAAASAQPVETGAIAGRVVDATSGAPIADARVIVTWPTPGDDGEPHEEVKVTDASGDFLFPAIPEGSYAVEFLKQGYAGWTMRDFAVRAGRMERADLSMVPASEEAGPPAGVEEVLVLGARVEAMEASRQESDEMINTLSAADISKFAATDVADVILRIPGVNVVEGQFAIIRGLEDRYSSTLYNNAPIPSPDPDRQSPQLDLFPTEIVSDLVVVKTFGPEFPSNSSGGSINVLTSSFPEGELEGSFKAKGGWNTNAVDEFLSLEENSPVGDERDAWNTIEQEYGGTIGGRTTFLGREFRYRMLGNWAVDYDTGLGFTEEREPRTNTANAPGGDLAEGELSLTAGRFDLTLSDREEQTTGFGAFGLDLDPEGNHGIDFSLFWTKKSDEVVQLENNGFLPGFDYLAPGGPVDLQNQNSPFEGDIFAGHLAGGGTGNATRSSWITQIRAEANENPERGPLFFSSFMESKSFERDRDLLVPQLGGRHLFDVLPGLELSWVGNYAKTTQNEDAYGARMRYEACGYSDFARMACPEGVTRIAVPTRYPVKVEDLGPGVFVSGNDLFTNSNDIDEHQWFGRGDVEYERELADWLVGAVRSGLWYERAERNVDSSYLEQLNAEINPATCPPTTCSGSGAFQAVYADTLKELGRTLFLPTTFGHTDGNITPTRLTEADAERKIEALNFGARTTFWEDLDLFGGVRLENIHIESNNDPFQINPLTGQVANYPLDNTPAIFPNKFLLFDRFGDNPRREGGVVRTSFNDQVLGLRVNVGPCRSSNLPGQDPTGPVLPGPCVDLVNRAEIEQFVNGEIDEQKVLPSVGATYRPLEGLALRAAWSRTVARPSFREMLYYVSVEPASDDLILGNPQLQLSDVESWDGRVEYFYGDYGDLVAIGGFYKEIDDPIESIIVRDQSNFQDVSTALYRTFFNNPNQATLWGIELEARKNLGFVRDAPKQKWLPFHQLTFLDSELFEFLSVGGNFTWIDAEVDRTEAELQRSRNFFPQDSGRTLDTSRRLYGQPEWMANADISFDHPDWGTSATLAFYAISDVLDAAGAATIGQNADVVAITLDRYVDSFHTLDLTFRQELWSDTANGLAVKFQARNLTNSRRDIVYDPAATSGKYAERSYKVGRDFSFELTYSFYELPFLRGD
jgi:TonB-dependent receptor